MEANKLVAGGLQRKKKCLKIEYNFPIFSFQIKESEKDFFVLIPGATYTLD